MLEKAIYIVVVFLVLLFVMLQVAQMM